jgi:predicted PurR-regulated permease PerM
MAPDGTPGGPIDPRATEIVVAGNRGVAAHLATLQGERLYRAAGLLFLLALIFRFFDPISRVLLIAFTGAILAVAFNSIINRIPLRRGLATIVVALLTLGVIAASVWFGLNFLIGQIRSFVQDMPSILAGLEEWEAWIQNLTGLDVELIGPRAEQIVQQVVGGGGAVVAGAFGLLEIVAISVLVLVGAFFVVARPNDQLLTPIMRTVPRERRPAFQRMFDRLGERLAGWLWGTLMSMMIIGALSVVVFWLLGVPYGLLLGILIGIIDIIPLVGPWIGGIVAVLVTLIYEPSLAIWVAVAVLAIQEVEGNVIRPVVMSESAKLHPFVTILALLLFGSIFGLLGAILALPITLALVTIVEVLWVEETIETDKDRIEPVVDV